MPKFMTQEEFRTEAGRKRAWRSLMWDDHGWLRACYDNSHQISDEAWRSFQPSPKKIAEWASERGIGTIINLRGKRRDPDWSISQHQPGFYWLEEEACETNGIKLLNIRVFSREAPPKEFLAKIDEAFRTLAYPVMMHCKSGADRAGIGSTLYMFLRAGKSLDEAQEQLSYKYGHVKSGKTGVLDHFFNTYRDVAERDGVTPSPDHFMDWVKGEYDPKAVQASFKPSSLGTFVTDNLLRRE